VLEDQTPAEGAEFRFGYAGLKHLGRGPDGLVFDGGAEVRFAGPRTGLPGGESCFASAFGKRPLGFAIAGQPRRLSLREYCVGVGATCIMIVEAATGAKRTDKF
jgi:hypothetical protein